MTTPEPQTLEPALTNTVTASPFTNLELLEHKILSDGSFCSSHAELRFGTSIVQVLANGSIVEFDQNLTRSVVTEPRAKKLLEMAS